MSSKEPRQFFVLMTEDDLPHLNDFDCGDEEMNLFLRDDCFDEQKRSLNATYLLYIGGDLAAFCSICADRLRLASHETDAEWPRSVVPAVKIARLGRSVRLRDLGVGRILLIAVYRAILDLAPQVGARFITLDAYPNRAPYYESLGFVQNSNQGRNSPTISMRRDIFEPFP